MTFEEARSFFETYHDSVVTTLRRSGAAQMSVVKAGAYQEGVVFVAIGSSAKLKNLARDPRCTLLTTSDDWSEWGAVQGTVEVRSWDNTNHEELRLELRDAFRACGGGEHPDWEEYDRVMKEDRREIVLIKPHHVYGQGV
ncbi:MAG: TIGR03618 family F420-dependent PPOX class oxidoreductase [Dehalococcoidia bacterium]